MQRVKFIIILGSCHVFSVCGRLISYFLIQVFLLSAFPTPIIISISTSIAIDISCFFCCCCLIAHVFEILFKEPSASKPQRFSPIFPSVDFIVFTFHT